MLLTILGAWCFIGAAVIFYKDRKAGKVCYTRFGGMVLSGTFFLFCEHGDMLTYTQQTLYIGMLIGIFLAGVAIQIDTKEAL